MCKIAILDRFKLFGSGIKSILDKEEWCEVIVPVENVDELFRFFKDTAPDVIVMDIIHGDNSGMKPLRRIRKTFPETPVLLIVSHQYADCFEEYIRLGVKGFIFNSSKGKELVKAIRKLKDGGEYFNRTVWDIFKSSIQMRKYHNKPDAKLTDREVAVLKLFSQGMSYKEIGASLNISPRTVETHKRNILSKLKIHSTADMVKYAYRNHMIV